MALIAGSLAALMLAGLSGPHDAHAMKERVAEKVALCAEELCQPLTLPETGILYSWTSRDATVVKVCGEHRVYTHTWRVAFCTAKMPAVTAADYGDAVGGIADRARHALGQPLIGSGVWPS